MAAGEDEMRERLHALFLDELEEQVDRIEHGLEVLAAPLPEPETDPVDEMFRAAHSLKGAAQAVGSSTVESLCHHLEEVLASLRDGSLEPDEPLLRRVGEVTDAVSLIGRDLRRGEPTPNIDVASLASALRADVPPESRTDRDSGPGTPAPPPMTRASTRPPSAVVRVGRERLDALLAQATDLLDSSYRSELLVTQLADAAGRTGEGSLQARRDQDMLDEALEVVARDDPRLRHALDRTRSRGRRRSRELEHLTRVAAAHQRALRGHAAGFAATTRATRTVPFADATAGLNKLVRDLSHQLGKQAHLAVHAAEVEIDKELVAVVHHVLGHLVRNAVDHGIEAPQERRRAGKAEVGTVKVDVAMRSDGIEVVVADDGRGVQLSEVRAAAEHLGLARDDTGATSLAGMLFQPGLSTAGQVSDVSGRGVGLDAVRAEIEAARGTVTLESDPGHGTRVRMLLPLTLSTLRAMLVRSSGEVVAVPASSIDALRRLPWRDTQLNGRPVVQVNGSAVPVLALSQLLGWEASTSQGERRDLRAGLVLTSVEGSVALVVDEFVGEREIVVRALPERLAGLSTVLGTAHLEDASPALVLSPSACVQAALSGRWQESAPLAETARPGRVLLVEDSVTTREFERALLESAGHTVTVAADGEQAWALLETDEFDVVVSDVNMPRMDGVALCTAIRSSRRIADLPVVLVSALPGEADRQRGLDAGADAYLAKLGLDRAQLLEAVERLL